MWQGGALRGRLLLAKEPLGAIAVGLTAAATEGALYLAIHDAGCLGPADTAAVRSGGARDAEGSKVRDADEDHVRIGPGDLLAGPAGGTVLLAGLRTDAGPQVGHAPTRETVSVLRTGIQEAPGAGRAEGLGVHGHVHGFDPVREQIQPPACVAVHARGPVHRVFGVHASRRVIFSIDRRPTIAGDQESQEHDPTDETGTHGVTPSVRDILNMMTARGAQIQW